MNLTDLPLEIVLTITAQLKAEARNNSHTILASLGKTPEEDAYLATVLSLSKTCTHLHTLLQPLILEKVTLRNTLKSSQSLTLLSHSSFRNQHVKILHFLGTAPGDAEPFFNDTNNILPSPAQCLLSNLHSSFPNLEKLIITFDFQFADCGKWEDGFYIFSTPECAPSILEAEQSEGWRALMFQTWSALIQNPSFSSRFKILEINPLVPKVVSAFSSPIFHSFLGRMEEVKIVAYSQDNGADWQLGKIVPHFDALVGDLIFSHLMNVKRLVIAGGEGEELWGETGYGHGRELPLEAEFFPLLEEVVLERVWICPAVWEFLAVTAGQGLRRVSLRGCMASGGGFEWNDLFHGVTATKSTTLLGFEVEPGPGDVPGEEENKFLRDQQEMEERATVKKMMREQPMRRMFVYGSCSDKYGWCIRDDCASREAFLLGRDQEAFDKLMSLVLRNKRRGKSGC